MSEERKLNPEEAAAWVRIFRLLPALQPKAQEQVDTKGIISLAWTMGVVADEIEALQGQVRTLNEKVETLTVHKDDLTRAIQILMGKEV